ncbi:MAG TPA: Nif3-like dinuclear metal center hexameric protein, partial [Chloroflexota bacterium]|nr:Nif3-like dinuclear metal center hexameric protein [Chloroflexota bacterium]
PVRLAEVAAYTDELLRVADYDEGEPSNGLMLDASRPVTRIAAAVNTSFRSIEGAAAAGAELLLVHHTTWASIDLQLKERKETALRTAGVSLYGAHLALDRHDDLSPSVVLARRLGVAAEARLGLDADRRSGVVGHAEGTFDAFVARAEAELGVRPDAWRNTDAFGRVAIVTGGAGWTSYVEAARAAGCDTYLTGEGNMYTKLFAREVGVNLVLGTHYATEQHGVQAWAAHVADRFGLPWVFVPEDAGIL